jgi:CrcB protein
MSFAMTMSLQPPSLLMGAAAVGTGAALGALLRWQLSAWLNPLHDGVPPGTLAANLIGGYLVGVAIAWFAQHPELSPAWRLFAITGFLGGLTTFSTFSAEVVALLQQGRVGMALAASGLHLAGSLLATWAGWATVVAVTRSPSA